MTRTRPRCSRPPPSCAASPATGMPRCDTRSAEPVEPRLRDALRQIADAESGIWGWIARDALDDRKATINGHSDAAPTTPDDDRSRRRRAATAMTTHRRPYGPPSLLGQAVISALLLSPARYPRELLAEAERRGQPDLARLARQVLAWRAGHRG